MFESAILWGIAWVLLAATTPRLASDAGLRDRHAARVVRALAIVLAVAAVAAAGGEMAGERWVRALVIASLTAGLVALGLSVFPRRLLAPVRIAARSLHRSSSRR